MALSLLKSLAEEKVVLLDRSTKGKLPFSLKGITRLINKKGDTLAVLLDKDALQEVEEDLEAMNAGFLASLEQSRRSGRVSGASVKARAGV